MVSDLEVEHGSSMVDDFAFSQRLSHDGPAISVNQHIGRKASSMITTMDNSAKSDSGRTATTATTAKSSPLTFLDEPYRTVIYHAHQSIGHPTTPHSRHIVFTKTHRLPSSSSSPIRHASTSATAANHLHYSKQDHRFPLSCPTNTSGSGWGRNNMLGISAIELEQLKRKRRKERALKERIKQSLRGEIASWDIDLGNTNTVDCNAAASGTGTGCTTTEASTSSGSGWSTWDSTSSTPVSDEEWGEDWDWGGDVPNFNELMVVDDVREQHWWEEQDDAAAEESDCTGCAGSLDSTRSSSSTNSTTETMLDGHLITYSGPILVKPLPASIPSGFPSPPNQQITLTPISPSLSPKLPSAIPNNADQEATITRVEDETLFVSFSTFGLNTPTRKRPHPSNAASPTSDVHQGSGAREQGDVSFLDEGLALHIKKKPFVRSCRI